MKCNLQGSQQRSNQPGLACSEYCHTSGTDSKSHLGLQRSSKQEQGESRQSIVAKVKGWGVHLWGLVAAVMVLGVSGVAHAEETTPVVPGSIDKLGLDYAALIDAVETGIGAFLTPVIIFMLGLVLVSAFVMWLTARKR